MGQVKLFNMGHSEIFQLVTVALYKLTGKEVNELGERNGVFAGKLLPTYCIRKDTEKADVSAYYLQFGGIETEEYFLFEVYSCDEMIHEEFDPKLFDDFVGWHKYFTPNTYEQMLKNWSSHMERLVFKMIFTSSNTDCGIEYDCAILLVGYLDSNLNLVLFNNQ